MICLPSGDSCGSCTSSRSKYDSSVSFVDFALALTLEADSACAATCCAPTVASAGAARTKVSETNPRAPKRPARMKHLAIGVGPSRTEYGSWHPDGRLGLPGR